MLILFFHFYTISRTFPFEIQYSFRFCSEAVFSNFLFLLQYFLPPRHHQMDRDISVPPPPTPTPQFLTSHTHKCWVPPGCLPWHRPLIPEMLRVDQKKKSVFQVSLSKNAFFLKKKKKNPYCSPYALPTPKQWRQMQFLLLYGFPSMSHYKWHLLCLVAPPRARLLGVRGPHGAWGQLDSTSTFLLSPVCGFHVFSSGLLAIITEIAKYVSLLLSASRH